MALDYVKKFYAPLLEKRDVAYDKNFSRIRSDGATVERLRAQWSDVKVLSVASESDLHPVALGQEFSVSAIVSLGKLTPADVVVEACAGPSGIAHEISPTQIAELEPGPSSTETGEYEFKGRMTTSEAGNFVFSVRVVPRVAGVPERTIPGLLSWYD